MTFFFGPPSPTSNLTVAAEQEITTLLNGRKFLIENHAKSRKFREFTRNRGQFQSPITIAPRRLRLSGPKAMYCWPYFWGLKIWPRFWLRSPEPPSLKSPLVLTSWVFGGSGLPHNVEDEISGLFQDFSGIFSVFSRLLYENFNFSRQYRVLLMQAGQRPVNLGDMCFVL